MRIRFLDGFDVVDQNTLMLKYPGTFVNFLQASTIPGRPGPVGSGPNGNSVFLFNTAFGEGNFTSVLDAQPTWAVHMDFRMFNGTTSTAVPDVEWYRIQAGTRTLLALRQRTDGKMDVRTYDALGNMTLLQTTAFVFTANQWRTLELLGTFGTTGSWGLRVNGTTVVASGSLNFGVALPDRFTYRFQGFGPPGLTLDNYVIADGAADYIGPCRITTLSPIADLAGGTWARNGAGSLWGAVSDVNGPDGDATYLHPPTLASRVLFALRTSPCFGLNLALALNVCGRPAGGSPHVGLVVREKAATNLVLPEVLLVNQGTTLSTQPGMAGYGTYQVLTTTSFESGGPWSDAQISNAAWGMDSDVAVADERVTQFYLEKLTSLLPLPYNCGGAANYSY